MAMLDSAKSVADAYFDELRDTAEIRQVYHDLIVSNAGTLFGAFAEDAHLKRRLTDALKLKTTDQSALLRGLFVQAVGAFDEFVRSLVSAVIEEKVKSSDKYSKLGEPLRNGFMSHSGRALSYYGSGTVNGVRYDFGKLTLSLAGCLSDSKDYFLDPRVFTITMGNSTPERLEKIFKILELPEPFSADLGDNSELKRATGETRKARIAELAKIRLSELIELRNNIAHGELTSAISPDEFQDNVNFLSALTSALKELCEK